MGIVRFENIESSIIELRGEKVILDSDVAELYGVETKDINRAVSNNPDKFPYGYLLKLTKEEKTEVVENFNYLNNLKFSPYLPKAFTERGLYMLATILKSPIATQTTIAIIETFQKLRILTRTIKELSTLDDKDKQKPLMQRSGEVMSEILDDVLKSGESETSIELNFAVLKFKHIIKKKKTGNR